MKTSFDFSREKLFRAPARKTLNSFARFAHLVRFYINNKGAISSYYMLRLRYFRIQLAITIICTWCFSSSATRHAENCKKRIAFDGWLQQDFQMKTTKKKTGKDCRKFCLRFNGTACHSFKPVKWSDFTFLSIYFYIREMMGKSDDSKEFCALKVIDSLVKKRLGIGKVVVLETFVMSWGNFRWQGWFGMLSTLKLTWTLKRSVWIWTLNF